MRTVIDFNEGWLFHKGDITVPKSYEKGPVYSQSKTERKKSGPASYHYFDRPDPYHVDDVEMKIEPWSIVSVPHDYIIDQDNNKNENCALGYFHYENAWYRKHFTLSADEAEGKRVLLRFDGIAGKSVIYLNGCLLYHNYSSYNSFEINISDYLFYDEDNVIAVYVNTDEYEGWWYQGGGIYRNVYLTITEPVAVDLWGVYAPYKKINDHEWQIDFETTVVNDGYDNFDVTAESTVIDQNGNQILTAGKTETVLLRGKKVFRYAGTICDPMLWDVDTPYLYSVRTVLKIKDKEVDEYCIRTGFRTVELSPGQGLLINGKKTFINGVCAHQDFGLTGIAVTENLARYKMNLIKEMGANGYRTAHYQQTDSYMDACDELGILVVCEHRWFESTKDNFEVIESYVKRDRNRPSVLFWSTSNEEPYHIKDVGRRIHRAISEHIKKFDNTRFIVAAISDSPEKSTIYDHCDAIGLNYNLFLYDQIHNRYPQKPIFASECCATGTCRDWNYPTGSDGRIRDFDVCTNSWYLSREKTYKFLKSKEYVIGGFQWTAVEHRGEAVWPSVCSKSGAIDLFLQKKGAFYQNMAHWTSKPMVHIVSHWNFSGMEGQDVFVPVYTNCEELELFLNGKSMGRKSIEKYGHGEWNIAYTPGTVTVKGYIDGIEVASDERSTSGEPVALTLTLDNDFKANGKDIALFTCECVDENGNYVPDASKMVEFSVAKPAQIIGTGSDTCDHHNVSDTERKMYMGKIRIAVKPEKGQKEITLTAFCREIKKTVTSMTWIIK